MVKDGNPSLLETFYFNASSATKEEHIQAIRDVLYHSVKVHMRGDDTQ